VSGFAWFLDITLLTLLRVSPVTKIRPYSRGVPVGRLIQCRTGHAYIGEFRRQFFPEKSVECECGETLQTREHILRTCARYTDYRESLQNEDREIALPELLGTPKGITALTEFLKESGAFTFTGERYMPKVTPTFEDEPEPPDIDSEDDASDTD